MYCYNELNQTFFSTRLLSALSGISSYGITIAEAPRSFGKSTALKHYFSYSEYDIKLEVCVDISQPIQFYKTLISLLMPYSVNKYDIENCNCENELLKVISLMQFRKKVLLYINNVHYFTYNTLNIIILSLLRNINRDLNIILEIRSSFFEKAKFKKYDEVIHYIGYSDFLLSRSDIKDYFALHSLSLSESDAAMLFYATNGWMPSVNLHLFRLLLLKEFSPDFSSGKICDLLYSSNSALSFFNINDKSFSRDGKMRDFLDCFMENQLFINDVITKLIDSRTNNKCLDSSDMFRYISTFICNEPSVKLGSYGLTPRELEIAFLVAKRYSNKEIADSLYISESTVKSYLKIIFRKVDIKSRKELFDMF